LHLVYLYIQKQHFLSIMLHKVYVNLCDIWVGSYVTQGTKAAQTYKSTYHWDDPSQIFLHLVYEFIRIFFFKMSPFWPLSGGGAIYDPGTLIAQT